MDIEKVTEAFAGKLSTVDPIGGILKLKLDDKFITINGTGETNTITNEDIESDCTISASFENFLKLRDGSLNPMMALMQGKIKASGNKALALKLTSLL